MAPRFTFSPGQKSWAMPFPGLGDGAPGSQPSSGSMTAGRFHIGPIAAGRDAADLWLWLGVLLASPAESRPGETGMRR